MLLQGAAFDVPSAVAEKIQAGEAELTARGFTLDKPKSLPLDEDNARSVYHVMQPVQFDVSLAQLCSAPHGLLIRQAVSLATEHTLEAMSRDHHAQPACHQLPRQGLSLPRISW